MSLRARKNSVVDDPGRLNWQLRERVKELTALHLAAKALQRQGRIDQTMARMLKLLPPAWQYPEITGVRICYCSLSYSTANFKRTRWVQRADFCVSRNKRGSIEVCYLERRPKMGEGPFLKEERALINSLAEMLRAYFLRQLYEHQLLTTNKQLEQRVSRRTADLLKANAFLKLEISERRAKDRKIQQYQKQLRALASELSLSGERERRNIATDLHDHIGQALAVIKMKVRELQGNTVFSGMDRQMSEIETLLEQTINYTRDLTFELSPPVLYELGFEPALDWLAEQFLNKHGLRVIVRPHWPPAQLSDDIRITLFKSIRELLMNVVKHAAATTAVIEIHATDGGIRVAVKDDGEGWAGGRVKTTERAGGFGLFSIRERLKCFGGDIEVQSAPGRGTNVTITCRAQPGGSPA